MAQILEFREMPVQSGVEVFPVALAKSHSYPEADYPHAPRAARNIDDSEDIFLRIVDKRKNRT